MVKVGGFELSVDKSDLLLGDSVRDFGVQTRLGRDNGDFGIGVEAVNNASSSNLNSKYQ